MTIADCLPPSVSIVLVFEDPAPKIRGHFVQDGEEHRMTDWLSAHPELVALIGSALEIASRERAA